MAPNFIGNFLEIRPVKMEIAVTFPSPKKISRSLVFGKSSRPNPSMGNPVALISGADKMEVPRLRGRLFCVIQFGNNSMMIRSLIRTRPWIQPLATYDPKTGIEVKKTSTKNPTCNFLWTQYKSQEFLNASFEGCRTKVTKNTETVLEVAQLKNDIEQPLVVHNHFEGVAWMCTKRGLFESLKGIWQPRSFILRKGDDFTEFADSFLADAEQGIWILKPSEFSNRGNGIEIVGSKDLAVSYLSKNPGAWLVQKYIENPLLLEGRKFDIRSYGLICSQDGESFRSYFYPTVYVRTASDVFSLSNIQNKFAHLNNDAVQKHGKNYGKIEKFNKLSLPALEKRLSGEISTPTVIADIKKITDEVFKACSPRLNPRKIPRCFEIVGFDFMIDATAKVWLIEANTNPCLELVNAMLSQLIPDMVDSALKLTLDNWLGGCPPPRETKWQEL